MCDGPFKLSGSHTTTEAVSTDDKPTDDSEKGKNKKEGEEMSRQPNTCNECQDKDKQIKKLETEARKTKKLNKDQEQKLKENEDGLRDLENQSHFLDTEMRLLKENKKIQTKIISVLERDLQSKPKQQKKVKKKTKRDEAKDGGPGPGQKECWFFS